MNCRLTHSPDWLTSVGTPYVQLCGFRHLTWETIWGKRVRTWTWHAHILFPIWVDGWLTALEAGGRRVVPLIMSGALPWFASPPVQKDLVIKDAADLSSRNLQSTWGCEKTNKAAVRRSGSFYSLPPRLILTIQRTRVPSAALTGCSAQTDKLVLSLSLCLESPAPSLCSIIKNGAK